jgi:predicted lipoprotein with Yx(FWY)xxD motif
MMRAAASMSVVVLVASGCGDAGSSKAAPPKRTAATAATATKAKPKPKRTGRRVTIHRSDYGRILADGRGRALYLFTHDDGKSRCYGDCASAWPPLLTKGAPRAGGRVKQKLLGTVRRGDGRRQVTYNGHPLYRYVGDREPGEVLCQAALEYGGYWYVVKRSGAPVK